jgi:hypothetical protein
MPTDAPFAPARGFIPGLNDGTLGLLATAILVLAAVLWSARGPNVERTDFSLTYVGATIVRHGLGQYLYDIALQKQIRDSLFRHPSPILFEHPPFEALLLSPLANFSYRTAYLLWGLLNAAVDVSLIVILRSHLAWPREDLGYVALWLLFAPLGVALYQGQSSVLLLAFYAGAYVQLNREREFMAGIALGFGLIKLQFVLPFAFIFLCRRKWRFLYGFAVTSVLLLVLSIVAVGWHGMTNYGHFLLRVGKNPQNISYGSGVDMPTIHGFVYALLGSRLSVIEVNLLGAVLSVVMLGWVAWHWRPTKGKTSQELMFAAAVATALVSGSHMFTHDFCPMILPMFLAGAHFSKIPSSPLRWLMVSTLLLFWTFPIYFICVAWHCLYLLAPVLLIFSYVAVRAANYAGQNETATLNQVAVG